MLCGCVRFLGASDTDGEPGAGDAVTVDHTVFDSAAGPGDGHVRPDGAWTAETGLDPDQWTALDTSPPTPDQGTAPDTSQPVPDLPGTNLPDGNFPVVGTLTDAHADCSTALAVNLSVLPVAVSVTLNKPASATAFCWGSPSVMIEISNAPASLKVSCSENGAYASVGWATTCPLSGAYSTDMICGTNPAVLPTSGATKSYIQLCLKQQSFTYPTMLVFAP